MGRSARFAREKWGEKRRPHASMGCSPIPPLFRDARTFFGSQQRCFPCEDWSNHMWSCPAGAEQWLAKKAAHAVHFVAVTQLYHIVTAASYIFPQNRNMPQLEREPRGTPNKIVASLKKAVPQNACMRLWLYFIQKIHLLVFYEYLQCIIKIVLFTTFGEYWAFVPKIFAHYSSL